MEKDESIQLIYAFVYPQTSKLWTMKNVIDAFEITGCKHGLGSQQLISNAISTFPHNLNGNASQWRKMRVLN